MDKVVAEKTSAIVERKAEESAEASEPKADLPQARERPASDVDVQMAPDAKVGPGTRKRPTSDMDTLTAPDANASRAGEPKKSKTLWAWACDKETSALDEACDGIKKEWDRASGKGRGLSTLIRDTDDWNHEKLKSVAMEFMRVSGEYTLKPELKEHYEELREMIKGMDRFDALRHWTGEAIQMVRNCECEGSVGADERTDWAITRNARRRWGVACIELSCRVDQ